VVEGSNTITDKGREKRMQKVSDVGD